MKSTAKSLIKYLTENPDTPHLETIKAKATELAQDAYRLQRLIIALENERS